MQLRERDVDEGLQSADLGGAEIDDERELRALPVGLGLGLLGVTMVGGFQSEMDVKMGPGDTVKVGVGGAAIRVLGAEHVAELEQVRQFFRNYAGWLGVDLSYQNFDEEMANLPGRYAAPEGRLFYAVVDGKGAGCGWSTAPTSTTP